jgi:hypothetical protein
MSRPTLRCAAPLLALAATLPLGAQRAPATKQKVLQNADELERTVRIRARWGER